MSVIEGNVNAVVFFATCPMARYVPFTTSSNVEASPAKAIVRKERKADSLTLSSDDVAQ